MQELSEAAAPTGPGGGSYAYRLATLVLYIAPVAYLGVLIAVLVHEVVGHGLTALAVGGEFRGFSLSLNGMGWAFTTPPAGATAREEILVLAGGVLTTTAAGLVFLLIAYLRRQSLFLRMFFLLLAVTSLLDGLSYAFWNSYHPVPPGDLGRIWQQASPGAARGVVLLTSGLLTYGIMALVLAFTFQAVEEWAGCGKPLEGLQRAFALVTLPAVGIALNFLFDWDQLAPGLGRTPQLVDAVVIGATILVLWRRSLKVEHLTATPRDARRALAIAWGATAGTILAVVLWLDRGILWS